MDRTELEHRMGYHKMSAPSDFEAMADLRQTAIEFGEKILNYTPIGREQSLAITHLEDSLMWAVKALALTCPLELGK